MSNKHVAFGIQVAFEENAETLLLTSINSSVKESRSVLVDFLVLLNLFQCPLDLLIGIAALCLQPLLMDLHCTCMW